MGEGTTAFRRDKGFTLQSLGTMRLTRGQIQPGDSMAKLQGDVSAAQFGRVAEPRRDLKPVSSLHIGAIGVDGSPEAPAETSQFLCPEQRVGLGTHE